MSEDGIEEREPATEPVSVEPDVAPLVVAFVCGALTGVAVALLCAPARGRDTRAWLKQRGSSAGAWAAQLAHDRREQLNALIRRYGVVRVFTRERPKDGPSSPARTM